MNKTKDKATAQIYLDELRPKENGKCSVKIKITFRRSRKYYSTGIELTPDEFEALNESRRKTFEQKEIIAKIDAFRSRAIGIIESIEIFTFERFNDAFVGGQNNYDDVSFAFQNYIQALRDAKRIGTASSYECAINSLKTFKKNLCFADITPKFLAKYEAWMLNSGKSITTVGIYLRSLRAIVNKQKLHPDLYPFGSEDDEKYEIPTGKNIKKALSANEINLIYNHDALDEAQDKAKDYWMFLYLSNGMNVKDFCLLRWENIKDGYLTYTREKTKRATKKNPKVIKVILHPENLDVIQKWGQPSLNKRSFVFPHLNENMSAERQREIVKQLTKTINKHMKRISHNLGINKDCTTYYARHSFATLLKDSGVQTEMISELLGHSSVLTTESYLKSFKNDAIEKQTSLIRPKKNTA